MKKFVYLFICLFVYSPVYAQSLTLPDRTTISGPSQLSWATNLGVVLFRATQFIFAFAGIGLLLMLLNAGFTLLTSAGDAKKLEAGKQQLTYAIVGFLVIFASYWLTQIMGTMFGIAEIKTIFQ